MSKLNIDQKTVKSLFSEKKTVFLIPDYQRPYAWEEKECQTLWDDLFQFAFPDNNCDKFDNESDEYFLGPIVTFKNDRGKMEIIDGQQRLTTLIILLRAFYDKYGKMNDEKAVKTSQEIEQCIWKTDEDDIPDKEKPKIESEVATEKEKEDFLNILRNGTVGDSDKSNYANNYRFFRSKIKDFVDSYPDWFTRLPTRIMRNCILLPIEAESQDTALRIFSTLNDRGKPLSDADIFKAQFYKYYAQKGEKETFIAKWKELETLCGSIFHPSNGTPMDELFTRYMYFERAKQGNKSSTTEALRKFYEKDGYALLKKDETFENLQDLASFWNSVQTQDTERFSDRVLLKLFVLNYAPNGMWTYLVSVYYMVNKDAEGKLEDESFYKFLNIITAFIWAYSITNPGINALRTPLFAEMINIVNKQPVTFSEFLFDSQHIQEAFNNYQFNNNRPITRSMLTWWAFQNDKQELLPLEVVLEIEHIYPRSRYEKEHTLSNPRNIETLGNKAILEKKINIRASDYRFPDKAKYYTGYQTARKQTKEGTKIKELKELAESAMDFSEGDIVQRNAKIILAFLTFMLNNNLLKNE